MIGGNCQQWSCIECVIKKQEYENNLNKLEQRFMVYKQKLVLTDELISKYNTKCKENENLQKQQKKYNALLKEYQSKLISAVTKQVPLEEELEKLKKNKVALEERLESETSRYAATGKHNIQLNNLVQQLKDQIVNFEMKLALEKEAASNLTRTLKEAEAEKSSVEKKRLKTLQNVTSFADFVQKEGRLTSAHKRMLARWRTELRCLVNGEGDVSEDEGIFSPALSSSCSSRDTGMGSITELLSDDDHSSVISVRLESNTSSVKGQSAAVPSDVTCKPLTSGHAKKVQQRNSSKPSSGSVVPPILGSKSKGMIGSSEVQLQQSSEVVATPGAEETVTEKRSEVDNIKFSDTDMLAGVTQKAGLSSGPKSLGPLSLFDPGVPLTLSEDGYNNEATPSEAVTNRDVADLVHVMDNSDCTLTITRVESPGGMSLCIENIMEEMTSIPNLLSPVDPEPETSRSHGQSNSSVASVRQVELHDASTWTWVETSDAAVGVDKIADCPHHVAVQTSGVTSCKTACQTNIITYNTCAVQTDDTDMLHTADTCSYTEDRFSNCRVPKEKTTCSIDKDQDKAKLFRNTVINDSALMNNSLKSYGSLSKGLKELNVSKLSSERKYVESKLKKTNILVRCDYKPETCLKEELKKWEILALWLCSDKSDNISVEEDSSFAHNFSTSVTAVQSRMSKPLTQRSMLTGDKHLTRQSTPVAGKHMIQHSTPPTVKCLTQQSTPTADTPLTQQNTPAHQNTLTASGVFAVEDAPHLMAYPKEIHPHGCLMPVVPYFQRHYMHMDPVLFQPDMLSCHSPLQSMAELWNVCCYRNASGFACAKLNHPCVSQGLQNYSCSCSPCASTNQSSCRPPKREAKAQISSVRSGSNKSAKRVWKRILDTEDSSDDVEAGDEHRIPHRRLCLRNHIVNSTSIADTDSEVEDRVASRRGIYADKQDYSVDTDSGRKMAIRQLRKRTKVHINGRDSALSMKGNKRMRDFSGNKKESRTFSELKKRKNKYNEGDEENVIKFMSHKTMGQKLPFPKLKCRSKHLMCRQLSEHVEEGDTPGMKVGNEGQASQHGAVKHVQDFPFGSHSVGVENNVQQKTGDVAATEEGLCKRLSHTEFVTIPDTCTGKEQHGGRTAVDLQTIQAQNVSDSLLNKCKRKASNVSASQVESRITYCSFSETRKPKRVKTGFISKGSGDSVTSNDSEATSSVAWHSISESSPVKYATRICRSSASIILPSVEQQSPNHEHKFSAANERFKVLNIPETGQEVASGNAGAQIRLSKLEKLRRNLMKAKRPSKIATELAKPVKYRKSLVPRSASSCAGSDCKKPGVRRLSETARKDSKPDSDTSGSNLFFRPPHQSAQTPSLKDEMPPTQHDTVAPNIVNERLKHSNNSNPAADQVLTSNLVTEQEPNTRRKIHTEANHAVDIRSQVSTDIVLDDKIQSCSPDSIPLSSRVMPTVSALSEVNNASKVKAKYTLMGKVPKAVEVPALAVTYKEGLSEASDTPKTTGLVTLPDVRAKAGDVPESEMEVCSSGVVHKTCEEARELGAAIVPTTTSKVGDMEDVMLPNFYQALVPCRISPIRDTEIGELQLKAEVKSSVQTLGTLQTPELPTATLPTTVSKAGDEEDVLPNFYQELMPCRISPIKDPEIGELQLCSEVKSSIQASDTMRTAEVPSAELRTESPVRTTRSSMYQTTDKPITGVESMETKGIDRKLFTGSLLEWVLKDYEIEYRKKKPKKRKSMKGVKQARETKQQEKVMFKKEIQQLLSSNVSSRKFQEVLKKFSDLKSESAPLVLAKIIVKVVSDDIKDQLNYGQNHSAPPLTPTQQFLVTLVFMLQSQHEQYKALLETILLGIEYQLFRLGHVPNVARACSLARFYAALCLVHRDKLRIQAFCYDAMYSLNYKAFPLLFTVYTTYPDALPHADVGKDILLVRTMSCLILTQSLGKNQFEYRIKDLKGLLQTRYGYSLGVPTTEQLLCLLLDRLRNSDSHMEGLQASLILLAKRMGWDTTYRQLLCHKLIPLVDEWKAGAVSDRTIVEVIIIMGYITRCFPTEEAKVQVQAVLHFLGAILLEQNVPIDVQEAAAASLLRLSRHNFFYVSDLLVKWQPSGGSISDSLLREMLPFLQLRNPKWWHTFLKRKQIHL